MPVDRQGRLPKRRSIAASLATMTVFASAALSWAIVLSTREPHLEVSHPSLDFGALSPGVQTTRTIKLKNSGHGTLAIQRVEASCACTGIKLDRESLGPQDVAELQVTMKGKAGGANAELRISSNDPARALTIIPITSIDGRSVVAEPAFVEFRGRGGKSEMLPVVVRLLYQDAEELSRKGIPRVRATSSAIDVIQPTQLDSRSLRFSVSVNQPLLRGMLRSAVVVEDSAGQALQIPVTVYVPSEYFLPLPAIVVNESEGRRNHILKLHARAGAAHPAKVSVHTDAGQWVVLSHSPLESADCSTSNVKVALSLREASGEPKYSEFPDESPADHLIVDVFDEAGQLLEAISVPISGDAITSGNP